MSRPGGVSGLARHLARRQASTSKSSVRPELPQPPRRRPASTVNNDVSSSQLFYDGLCASAWANKIHPLKAIDLVDTAVEHGRHAPEAVAADGGNVFKSLVKAFISMRQYDSVVRLIESSTSRDLVDLVDLAAPVANEYIDSLVYMHGQHNLRARQRAQRAYNRRTQTKATAAATPGKRDVAVQTDAPAAAGADTASLLVRAAEFVEQLEARGKFTSSVKPAWLHRLIGKLHEERRHRLAVTLINLALKHDFPLDVKSWNVLLAHRSLQLDPAQATLQTFMRMKRAGVIPDQHSLGLVVNALKCDRNYIPRALELLKEGRLHGLWNAKLATDELHLVKRTSPPEQVIDRFCTYFGSELPRMFGVESNAPPEALCPDGVAVSLLIDTLVKLHRTSPVDVERLYDCYTRLLEVRPDLHRDSYSMSIFVASFVRHRSLVTRSLELLEEMQHRGLRPTIVTYTIVVDGLTKHGAPELAIKMYDRMRKQLVVPDARFFERSIQASLQQGDRDAANAWLLAMRQARITPSKHTQQALTAGVLPS
ncbi:hypothetical protein PYCC9005_003370 [Savitreella phatthalungensis]